MTKLNVPEKYLPNNTTGESSSASYVNESLQEKFGDKLPDSDLQMSLKDGFEAGASHVHTIVGAMLFLYFAQGFVYLVATKLSHLFESEEKALEFYTRLSKGFLTGRFLMAVVLFEKTIFTFVTYGGVK